jgi:tight adherence protein B
MSPLIIIVIVGIVLAGGLVVGGLVLSRNQPSVVQERLGRYTDLGAATVVATPQSSTSRGPRESPVGKWLNELLRERSFFAKMQLSLSAADLKINVGEFFAISLLAALGGIVFGALFAVLPDCATSANALNCFLTRNYLDATIFGIVGGGVGAFIPNFIVGFRKGGRLKAFDNQLGDTLSLLVNALRSGYSVLQAMEAVSKELAPPVSVEFRRVVQEVQLGLPMEAALDHLLDRISSEDLDLVVTAMNIQREVGGNLAEILEVISHTIRERIRIKGEIEVLTAQGMATGYAITFMPIALVGILYFVNRPYIMQFFEARNQPCGWGMIIASALMIAMGGFIIRKIVDIEV